jgi:hypothetical protein
MGLVAVLGGRVKDLRAVCVCGTGTRGTGTRWIEAEVGGVVDDPDEEEESDSESESVSEELEDDDDDAEDEDAEDEEEECVDDGGRIDRVFFSLGLMLLFLFLPTPYDGLN